MGPVLVDGIVDVDEDDLDVVCFLGSAVRIDAGDADELKEVEEDGLGQSLEVEGALAVAVARDSAITVGRRR